MFKALVGLAAVAIIAYVSYFFWGIASTEWQKQRSAELSAQSLEAEADQSCEDAKADMTAFLQGQFSGRRYVQYDERAKLRACVAQGRLTQADVQAFGL